MIRGGTGESRGGGRTGLPPVALPGKGLPVRGIFGLAFAPRSAVTAVGPIGEDGCLPGYLFDHLVQVQDPALGWHHTCQRAQQQREDMNVRGGPWTTGLALGPCRTKPVTLDNKMTITTMAIKNTTRGAPG